MWGNICKSGVSPYKIVGHDFETVVENSRKLVKCKTCGFKWDGYSIGKDKPMTVGECKFDSLVNPSFRVPPLFAKHVRYLILDFKGGEYAEA